MVTVGSVGLTYDALDRMVEQNAGGSYTQLVYGPNGNKLALMNGQTLFRGRVPLPGGVLAIYWSNPLTLVRYWHSNWQGSGPAITSSSQTMLGDEAYAPYGEQYAENGGAADFTGQWAATEPDLYDFPYREYHPTQGRWLTPDPAGLAAVNPSNPQSWNRYAYVTNNPLAKVDPLGLASAACLFAVHRRNATPGPCGGFYDSPDLSSDSGGGAGLWGGLGNNGYSIADAISGAPGTYLSYDVYGNVSFGFSIGLYEQTENYIDTMTQQNQNNPMSTGIPTSGYTVVEQNLGTGVQTTGLIPEMEAMAQERLQLADSTGWGGLYLWYITNFNASPENWAEQNLALSNTMQTAGQSGLSPNATLNQAYTTDFANFLQDQANFLGFPANYPYLNVGIP
jgi:RHS repeat-associated protein